MLNFGIRNQALKNLSFKGLVFFALFCFEIMLLLVISLAYLQHNLHYVVNQMIRRENTMQEKKMTGYPSIDKPWLKYYKKTIRLDKSKSIY